MFGNFIGKCLDYFYSHHYFCPIKLSKMRLPIGIMLFILFSRVIKLTLYFFYHQDSFSSG